MLPGPVGLLDVTGLGDTVCLRCLFDPLGESSMRPVSRHAVSKHKSARKFNSAARTVAKANTQMGPMRGGWRL